MCLQSTISPTQREQRGGDAASLEVPHIITYICMCNGICVYICTYVCKYSDTHTYIHTFIYVLYTCVSVYVYTYTCIYLCICVYVFFTCAPNGPRVPQDVRLDERVEQLFGIVNSLVSNSTAAGLRQVLAFDKFIGVVINVDVDTDMDILHNPRPPPAIHPQPQIKPKPGLVRG